MVFTPKICAFTVYCFIILLLFVLFCFFRPLLAESPIIVTFYVIFMIGYVVIINYENFSFSSNNKCSCVIIHHIFKDPRAE